MIRWKIDKKYETDYKIHSAYIAYMDVLFYKKETKESLNFISIDIWIIFLEGNNNDKVESRFLEIT